jgi:hypothetical protein
MEIKDMIKVKPVKLQCAGCWQWLGKTTLCISPSSLQHHATVMYYEHGVRDCIEYLPEPARQEAIDLVTTWERFNFYRMGLIDVWCRSKLEGSSYMQNASRSIWETVGQE